MEFVPALIVVVVSAPTVAAFVPLLKLPVFVIDVDDKHQCCCVSSF